MFYGFFSWKNKLPEGLTMFRKFVPPIKVGLALAGQLVTGVDKLLF